MEATEEASPRCEIRGARQLWATSISASWVEAEIEVAQSCRAPRISHRGDASSVASINPVHTIIEPPAQTVDVAIGHAQSEPFYDYLPHIRASIPVSIFKKDNFRRCGDQHSAIPGANRSRETQMLGEERAPI